jgi:hypothetical protein
MRSAEEIKELEKWFNSVKKKQFDIVTDCRYEGVAEKLTSAQHSILRIIGNAKSYKDLPNIPIDSLLSDIRNKFKPKKERT